MKNFSGALAALSFVLFVVASASAADDCSWTVVDGIAILDTDCTTDNRYGLGAGTWDLDWHTITSVDPVGGHFKGGVLEFIEDGVHVRNGVVSTDGLANVCDGGEDRLRGIYSNGFSGSITNLTVVGINQGPSGCQEGVGIEFRNIDGDEYINAVVENCTIVDYQKGGVVFNGLIDVQMRNCVIEGGGMIGSIAQNGLQGGYGARGQATGNYIDGNWYTGSSWTSSGVLLFETDNFHVVNNVVRENQSGMVIETWHWLEDSASRNHFVNNDVLESLYGITASAYILGGYSMGDAFCMQNRIQNNRIENSDSFGDIAIYLGGGYYFGADMDDGIWFNSGNRVVNNATCGFETSLLDEGDNNRLQRNTDCSDAKSFTAGIPEKFDPVDICVEPYE